MDEIKIIKKYYGEEFAHFARDSFPSILEDEGLLFELLKKHFDYNKELYNDIIHFELELQFKEFIYSLMEEKEELVVTKFTPFELMDKAGYKLYECKTEEDIQSFKKYYAPNERLCTFNGNRLNKCYVFFAVKKDVDKIKREDFSNPKRQDKYGTSVISIQFSKGNKNYLSIKNRYNHTVSNPDATFSNNLDNIIQGLTKSFEEYYKLNLKYQNQNFEIPGYVCVDGKYYKYNYEIDGIYYGPNNLIIKDDKVLDEYLDKSRYLVIDYFILDMKEKKIILVDNIVESFHKVYTKFNKISITKFKEDKIINLEYNNSNVQIIINKNNCMTYLKDSLIREVPDNYLKNIGYIQKINLENATKIGSSFLHYNSTLSSINISNVIEIDNHFLMHNTALKELLLPNVQKIGHHGLIMNSVLKKLYVPELIRFGSSFMENGGALETLNLPKVTYIYEYCFRNNNKLKEISIPNVTGIQIGFLVNNNSLEEFFAPKLEYIGDDFLKNNEVLKIFYAPSVRSIRNNFLENNKNLEELYFSKLTFVGSRALMFNNKLKTFYAPKLTVLCNDSLKYNIVLKNTTFASDISIGNGVFSKNYLLKLRLHIQNKKVSKILRKKLD